MRTGTVCFVLLAALASAPVRADINLAPGTAINFGDGTSQSTAAGSGSGVPSDHGGTNCTVSGAGAFVGGGDQNTASGDYSAVAGGQCNQATASYATIAGGGPSDTSNPTTTSNTVTDNYGTVCGGADNQAGDAARDATDAEYATVSGGRSNTASGEGATVGGGEYNSAEAAFATIAGGGPSDTENPATTNNQVTDDYGTVGGGGRNQAGDASADTTDAMFSTVAGGENNIASGYAATIGGGRINQATNWDATVAGGFANVASGVRSVIAGGYLNTATDSLAFVGAGQDNAASGTGSVVTGGGCNTASGTYSAVLGGFANEASGHYSFALGQFALASHDDSFVWNSYSHDRTSYAAETFNVHASGGIYFNGGSVHTTSDRNAKADIEAIEPTEVLDKVVAMPISTWRYKDEEGDRRHIGPMSQDFHAAFPLGGDNRFITTVDVDGVALAAIQGLHARLSERDRTIQSLTETVVALAERLEALEKTAK